MPKRTTDPSLAITRQTSIRVPRQLLGKVYRVALQQARRNTLEISLALVTPATIRRINRERRGVDKPTDVLAFALTPQHGEILIAPRMVAHKFETSKASEAALAVTFLHGLLHVLGFTHERSPRVRTRMAAAERAVIGAIPKLAKATNGMGLLDQWQ